MADSLVAVGLSMHSEYNNKKTANELLSLVLYLSYRFMVKKDVYYTGNDQSRKQNNHSNCIFFIFSNNVL